MKMKRSLTKRTREWFQWSAIHVLRSLAASVVAGVFLFPLSSQAENDQTKATIRPQTGDTSASPAVLGLTIAQLIDCPRETEKTELISAEYSNVKVKVDFEIVGDCWCTNDPKLTDSSIANFIGSLDDLVKGKPSIYSRARLQALYFEDTVPLGEDGRLGQNELNALDGPQNEVLNKSFQALLKAFHLHDEGFFQVELEPGEQERTGPILFSMGCQKDDKMRRFHDQLQPVLAWIFNNRS